LGFPKLVALTLPALLWAGSVWAAGSSVGSGAGSLELSALTHIVTGNIGLTIGLLVTIWGLWKTVVGGDTGSGLIIMVCGVLVTLFPGVSNAAVNTFTPLVNSMTGN
jgi:hypothetical protein